MKKSRILISVTGLLALAFSGGRPAMCADWPMWRFDTARSAVSPEELPDRLRLAWERVYSPRVPVWDDALNHDLMPYDTVFEPVVAGKTIFLGFNDSDKLVALDTESGQELWSFYCDGPVRLPPVTADGRVFFVSDDGHLYCLNTSDGSLLWKFRGGPSSQKVLGNGRLITTWPARGGPVLVDGTVYFAAGIWPFLGTFIYALDAASGQVRWINDSTGAQYILQPHNSPAFAGVAPQGAMVVVGDKLLVPGGRSVPAAFNRQDGSQLYYHLAKLNKTGGSFVCASEKLFFNHYREGVVNLFEIDSGEPIVLRMEVNPVVDGGLAYFGGSSVTAYDLEAIQRNPKEWKASRLWEVEADGSFDLIKAGDRLYAAGPGGISQIELEDDRREAPEVERMIPVEREVRRLIAADEKLFAVTADGRLLAFDDSRGRPARIDNKVDILRPSARADRLARSIIRATGVRDGYALVYGAGGGGVDLLGALANRSGLKLIAFAADAAVDGLRRRLDSAGFYGNRIALHGGDPTTAHVPPYIASLTVVNDPSLFGPGRAESNLRQIFRSMRPYGGTAWISITGTEQGPFVEMAESLNLPGLKIVRGDDALVISREGPLPGSAPWTHQYGNVAQTVKSDDRLVKLPLGILWFGGNSNEDVLPRHGHGPPEQVVGGRLFIEGMDCLSARDVYTGRVLWKTELPGLGNFGVYYDESYKDTPTSTAYNQEHLPGANVRGSNFVATADRVYVVVGGSCWVLDSVTGKRLADFNLPRSSDGPAEPQWGYIGIAGDHLIAGSGFTAFSAILQGDETFAAELAKLKPRDRTRLLKFTEFDKSASQELVVMDRHSGEISWYIRSQHGFLHNGIVVGNGRLYCLDKRPPYIENRFRRRGMPSGDGYRLRAFDLRTGEPLWERDEGVFGSWLGFSEEHDILMQSTRPSSDMVRGETGERMAAYKGADGVLLWDKELEYRSVPIIHGDRIITIGSMYDLATGELIRREHPISGESVPWTWLRNYGCNYPIACENLLTFRSAAAGYYDLASGGGTGNWGGFKSGCTSNLVAADGVINAPDYTRTCSCSYQNQTSLALVHMPEVEIWSFSKVSAPAEPVKRIGINLGAPGDRVDGGGTLWLDYPSVGGPSPDIPVTVSPAEPKWFYHHSSKMSQRESDWITSSGAGGLERISLTLASEPGPARTYTVKLYFAEQDDPEVGGGMFDVSIQGRKVLEDFNVLAEAGEHYRTVVKEFGKVRVSGELVITLDSQDPGKPTLCGIEVTAEGW
ncbi:PQQ-binding-like beta-propeller repeat protein [candidate division KSB1 bacterium]